MRVCANSLSPNDACRSNRVLKSMSSVLRSLDTSVDVIQGEYEEIYACLIQLQVPRSHPIYMRIDRIMCIKAFVIEASILLHEEFETGLYSDRKLSSTNKKSTTAQVFSAVCVELDAINRSQPKFP